MLSRSCWMVRLPPCQQFCSRSAACRALSIAPACMHNIVKGYLSRQQRAAATRLCQACTQPKMRTLSQRQTQTHAGRQADSAIERTQTDRRVVNRHTSGQTCALNNIDPFTVVLQAGQHCSQEGRRQGLIHNGPAQEQCQQMRSIGIVQLQILYALPQ